jgi:5-hydroxyisourate hydrolase
MHGQLSTHVLNIATGRPAAGVTIKLWRLEDKETLYLKTVVTNVDGRTDQPLLAPAEMIAGTYELVFEVGAYFGSEYTFLSEVPVRFRIISIEERYHVPLLVSPWAYSIYRGS